MNIVLDNIFSIIQVFPKPFWIAFAAILVLTFIISLFRGRGPKFKYLYERREFVMSHPERDFFFTLTEIIGETYWVFPQIRLSSLLKHKIRGQIWIAALSRINQKSVDFVLTDKKTLRLVLAIELDEPSHDRANRKERDEFVEHAMEVAKLPLLRVRGKEASNREELLRRINKKLLQ